MVLGKRQPLELAEPAVVQPSTFPVFTIRESDTITRYAASIGESVRIWTTKSSAVAPILRLVEDAGQRMSTFEIINHEWFSWTLYEEAFNHNNQVDVHLQHLPRGRR